MILGIDEVGRGSWAGPLVVGAVVLGGAEIEGLTDSKKLSKKRREELDKIIREKATGFGLGWVEAVRIDEIGLSEALKLATRRAVEQIHASYNEIIIDGTVNFLAGTNKGKYVTTMKKADLLVPSVSAASIVAKVARDNFMSQQDAIYLGYNFKKHVGYGTLAHRQAIEKLGVTPLHRLSFAPLAKYNNNPSCVHTFVRNGFAPGATRLPRAGRTWAADVSIQKHERSSATATTKQIGNLAETEAANYLVRHRHKIIDRNWKNRFCEIDIVSKNGDKLYFTEVKYRRDAKHGDGLSAVTSRKLNQMKFAARYYIAKHQTNELTPILCTISLSGEPPEVEAFLDLS